MVAMQALRQYMEEHEISQAELARRVGVQQPTVWEWLNGHCKPSTSKLIKLSAETGISVDELIKESAP
jgi:transcriptional regulator with XRE-family HTH domain